MKFFKCVCTSWSVIPLDGNSLFGYSRIVAGVRSHTIVAIYLIFCIRIRTVDRFVFPVPLRPCMTFFTRPGRFAFRGPRGCVFKKVKLGGELSILESLPFFVLGVDMRGPLLILSQSATRDGLRRTLNNLTSPLNFCLSNFTPPRESK